jgi:isochorismate synthase
MQTDTSLIHTWSRYAPAAAFRAAQKKRLAVALWRMPGQSQVQVLVDFSGKPTQAKLQIEEAPQGFAISPFLNPEGQATYFLQADWYYKSGESLEFPDIKLLSKPKQSFFESLRHFLSEGQQRTWQAQGTALQIAAQETDKEKYQALVRQAIDAIVQGAFRKVVTSRKQIVDLEQPLPPTYIFERLCERYPQAFVSLFFLPEKGVWLGASPEVLVSVNAAQEFRTMALAGTQARQVGKSLAEAVWTQKEIEEQALVSRYIINCLKKIRVREFEEVGPRTVQAGNLLHLQTDFLIDLQAINYPQLPSVMLDLLHPTSAVCGMPKAESLAFLLGHEGYERDFYSGYLGPVNIEQETHLFVNLRCMQWQPEQLWLYAGGGITIDSQPEKEWQETVMKCQTMLQVL